MGACVGSAGSWRWSGGEERALVWDQPWCRACRDCIDKTGAGQAAQVPKSRGLALSDGRLGGSPFYTPDTIKCKLVGFADSGAVPVEAPGPTPQLVPPPGWGTPWGALWGAGRKLWGALWGTLWGTPWGALWGALCGTLWGAH